MRSSRSRQTSSWAPSSGPSSSRRRPGSRAMISKSRTTTSAWSRVPRRVAWWSGRCSRNSASRGCAGACCATTTDCVRRRSGALASKPRTTARAERQVSAGELESYDAIFSSPAQSPRPDCHAGLVSPLMAGTGFPLGSPQADLGWPGLHIKCQLLGAASYSRCRPAADHHARVVDDTNQHVAVFRHRHASRLGLADHTSAARSHAHQCGAVFSMVRIRGIAACAAR